ncbi:MAG: TrmH family RNA methyltransferase [Veillonella sp.]|nr:TrmH family RNA methyltransferase [Veillonella sp.]
MEIVLYEPEIPGNTGNIARLCAANHMTSTTKAKHTHSEVKYEIGDMLVFGPETRGLPESLLDGKEDTCIRIPMVDEARSLNLSNAVAIIAYEGMRQLDYPDLKAEGNWIQSK